MWPAFLGGPDAVGFPYAGVIPGAGGLIPIAPNEIPVHQESPKINGASIWYLGHCGFAVRTSNHLLIFDYQELRDGQQPKSRPPKMSLGNGWINPEEIKNLSVRVFVSHSHNDHYDPVVLEWRKAVPDIEYFFGWKAADDTSFHYLVGPRAEYKCGGLEIATINSHHSGVPEVAWLVKVDGFVIYHNGDCQPGDPVSEYEFLKTKAERIDVAFLPPVHEERLKYGIQNLELFRKFSPRLVLPMHARAGDAMYRDFEKAWRSKVPGLSVAIPMKMGERFVCEPGRTEK
jgi:L-ascorbate metabolism protein UlaG (beta-lactamase superfamily)